VIGVDGIPEALDAVRSGNMSATVAQSPFMMGQLAVEACLAALRGRPVPATIQTPTRLVTALNGARGQLNLPQQAGHFEDPLMPLIGS
jgi:ABC-type sugar transport system substrate-binding protein